METRSFVEGSNKGGQIDQRYFQTHQMIQSQMMTLR